MIIYDCEIIKGIAQDPLEREPDIEYCDGWRDFENMGISCIGAYDYATQKTRLFLKDNMDDFQRLIEDTDYIVGFNNIAFDDQLCAANGIHIPSEKSKDLLVAIWEGLGLNTTFQSKESHGGYGLNTLCHANFGIGKTGHGALAPNQWQRRQYGRVIDYCLGDIGLTKRLLDLVNGCGLVTNPKDPDQLIPVAWDY